MDKLMVCRWETPGSWLFIDDGAEDVYVASEDEGGDESTLGDGTGNGIPWTVFSTMSDQQGEQAIN